MVRLWILDTEENRFPKEAIPQVDQPLVVLLHDYVHQVCDVSKRTVFFIDSQVLRRPSKGFDAVG